MLTAVNSKKLMGLSLVVFLVAGLITAWLIPNGPLSSPKAAVTTANDNVPAYTDRFRFGTNMGYRNDSWNDSQYSDLVAGLGMNSFRVSLPEDYLATWGYDVALANMQHYKANNLNNLTAFLGTPTRAHSNAPGGGDLSFYSPKNLYEPIWNVDGSVNQNNYWAAYVYKTVSTYKPYVKTWEVWNEPDFTYNWDVTQNQWWNGAPNPSDLNQWNDSIFSYVRLLRVSYEVIKKADSTALVATGGFGYESWLDGVLRYSDNPAGGAVNNNYPLAGGAYFDVMSYHNYPQYAVQDPATGTWLRDTDSDSSVNKILLVRDSFQKPLKQRGYDGSKYPTKHFIITETGVSSQGIGGNPGSMDLFRNYFMKLQVLAPASGVKQVHTYMLTDQEPDSTSSDSYNHMGMYYDIKGLGSPSQASRKPASYGAETVARTLEGATYDGAATAALKLPAGAKGAVFQNNGQRISVLWAQTKSNSEAASLSFALPVGGSVSLRNWQWAQTKAAQTLTPDNNGQVQLTLSASPVLLIDGNASSPAATATPTKAGSTATPTSTALPAPTATNQPQATATPTKTSGPAATATSTALPAPTATNAPAATATPTKTNAPQATSTPAPQATSTPAPNSNAKPQRLTLANVSASGSDQYSPVISLMDNNLDSYWAISGAPPFAWAQLDLGKDKQLSEIRYFVLGEGHAEHTRVEYSSDGKNWKTFSNATDLNTGLNWGWHSIATGKITARYVRFFIENPGTATWTLGFYSEMQVWGN